MCVCMCVYCVCSVSSVSVIVFSLCGCLCCAVEGCYVNKGALPKGLLVAVVQGGLGVNLPGPLSQTDGVAPEPRLQTRSPGVGPQGALSPVVCSGGSYSLEWAST